MHFNNSTTIDSHTTHESLISFPANESHRLLSLFREERTHSRAERSHVSFATLVNPDRKDVESYSRKALDVRLLLPAGSGPRRWRLFPLLLTPLAPRSVEGRGNG